jgi:glutamate-1-semialdehyde 2,1-aminomutase
VTGPIAGFTSTASKRPETLFGSPGPGLPSHMTRSSGCRVWDAEGREYIDYLMGLGAVALGYGHPAVTRAAIEAVEGGVVGPLPPVLEEELGAELRRHLPWMEQSRFLKTGAEAMAAAVRLARTATGREYVLGCGYHGWLDWCQGIESAGVPAGTHARYGALPFNDAERARELIRAAGDRLAAVVFEPVIVREPDPEWLAVLREETTRVGALLVVDEIKTVCRLALGGGTERYRIAPDLAVLGKAIANGFPLAVVGGRAAVMAGVAHTWISSTLATEWVALAAARATLAEMVAREVPRHLSRVGARLLGGLEELAIRHPSVVTGVGGLPEMCFLQFRDDAASRGMAAAAARRGLLFKRSAYNFVSLAHTDGVIDRSLEVLAEALSVAAKPA